MATLNIKALSAGISLFALFMVGTISAKANTHEDEKKEKEAETKTAKVLVNQTWYFHGEDSEENVIDANLYQDTPSTEKDCGPLQTICSISAPEDPLNPGHPKMDEPVNSSQNVADQILEARENLEPNDTVTEFREF